MSIIFESEKCFLISHDQYIRDVYKKTYNNEKIEVYAFNEGLFKINKPYKKANLRLRVISETEDLIYIRRKYKEFKNKISTFLSINDEDTHNSIALTTAEAVYDGSADHCRNSYGENNFGHSTVQLINNNFYLFPRNCKFYNYDVNELQRHLKNKLYDAILLDPPWWNKYIRRKRKKSKDSYDMMYNSDLLKLPIANMLQDTGIVVVWCTNSQQHISAIEDMFSAWKLKVACRWFWLKVTVSGEPICDFSKPPGKQPFENIIFGCSVNNSVLPKLKNSAGTILVSVPSSLHSHKPPLVELLKRFLPDNPKCLEIFARYLLPDWDSYGLEAMKFQHICAYTKL